MRDALISLPVELSIVIIIIITTYAKTVLLLYPKPTTPVVSS